MAYPFLPVNPSCSNVVINDPCGCSSVISNTGCNNNLCGTNLTASSTIVYNGPVLACTSAEPCDTLNVIFQKFDSIICNLLSQINTLTVQVNNISIQILNINSEIITINNELNQCCTTTTSTTAVPTTTTTSSSTSTSTTTSSSTSTSTSTSTTTAIPTTTSTTTVAIDCIFEGYAEEVTTTTTTTAVPTTTTTSSSTSSTTTTTTTVEPTTTTTTTSTPSPQCYNVEVYPPVFNPGTFHIVEYIDCLGDPQTISVPDGGDMVPICAREITSNNNNGATNTTGICTL